MDRLRDRIAVVFGAGSGMGTAVAERFAREGAVVYLADLDEQSVQRVSAGINAAGGTAVPVKVDATSRDQVEELLSRIDHEHEVLHVLHSQVGMPGAPGIYVSEEDFDTSINVNIKSAFFPVAAAMPLLVRAKGVGAVTLIASTAALVGSPFSPLYSLTKGAIVSYARALALAAAPQGVRVNVICPGPIDTPMLPRFFGREPGADIADLMDAFVTAIPMQRPGTPQEVAGAAAFLASDDAGFVTGVALPVDGGQIAK
jgi:NAD(P)-dependent dehydrogenase (short-subunit alcohol dehydrogenase family)